MRDPNNTTLRLCLLLLETLSARGVHETDCGAYRELGRFGSRTGMHWKRTA